ncbi:MAG: dihydrofolate reductase [Akkermansia sp.]|nr:dihydrofolate reductase [Akkermansiaceae bacterium]MBQ3144069.1 dihydrofolate reductase [Akkermansia sp.]
MTPTFTGVVAMAADRAIGIRQSIPWRLPEDMKLFKRLTMGHPILMGRKTWESLGRPLPGRQNIVLTRDTSFTAEGATVIHSVDELAGLELMDREVMVIGGAQIYAHLLPKMQKLYVSEVQGEYAADTWFPEFAHHFLRSTPVEQFDGFRLVLYEK